MGVILVFVIGAIIGALLHDIFGPLRGIRQLLEEAERLVAEADQQLAECRALREEHERLFGGAS